MSNGKNSGGGRDYLIPRGPVLSFKEAFPQIETILLTINKTGKGINWDSGLEDPGKGIYTESNFPGEYIPCRNPLCRGGGFQIGNIIRKMVQNVEENHKGSSLCSKVSDNCSNHITYSIQVDYKKEIPQEAEL